MRGIAWTVLGMVCMVSGSAWASNGPEAFFKCNFRGDIKGASNCEARGKFGLVLGAAENTSEGMSRDVMEVVCDGIPIYRDGLRVETNAFLKLDGIHSPANPFPPRILTVLPETSGTSVVTAWLRLRDGILRGFCEFHYGDPE